MELTTMDGILELSRAFGERNCIKDPSSDNCKLQPSSLSDEFQTKYPELRIGKKVASIHEQTVSNFSDV
jgi:hypothetical protein